jgi:hypothetical protein
MKRRNFILVSFILYSVNCAAQPQFRFKRSIAGVDSEAWYSLSLPPQIFSDLNSQLSDLRLYSVNDTDTLEVPYILDIKENELVRETVHLPLFNKSSREGVLYLTFESKTGQQINSIDLKFHEQNYFGVVALEGSFDQREWFAIAQGQRIVSIKNNREEYDLSTVNFPVSRYRYFRVAVTSDARLNFREASFQYNKITAGIYHDIPLAWELASDKKTRRSMITVKLQHYVPVTSIAVRADSTGDYYRSFRIEAVRDSAQTANGWIKYFETLYEGNLTSFERNEFNFDWKMAKEMRIVIEDLDNAPLAISKISAAGPDVQVISRLRPGQNIMLYGAETLTSPSYDLTYFENKIPGAPRIATFEPAQDVTIDESGARPLFESKIWLWSIMGLMIMALGFFTIRMMKEK